jgi:hypothetical protein
MAGRGVAAGRVRARAGARRVDAVADFGRVAGSAGRARGAVAPGGGFSGPRRRTAAAASTGPPGRVVRRLASPMCRLVPAFALAARLVGRMRPAGPPVAAAAFARPFGRAVRVLRESPDVRPALDLAGLAAREAVCLARGLGALVRLAMVLSEGRALTDER